MSDSLPQVMLDAILLKGGLDQITPTLSLPSGAVRQALNYECAVAGGYSRIQGYERFDGHVSPSDTSNAAGNIRFISFANFVTTPTVGQPITTSAGATGIICLVNGLTLAITKQTGSWSVGDTVSAGSIVIGIIDNAEVPRDLPINESIAKCNAADIYRVDIDALPGSGDVRGVSMLAGVVYGFRDNLAGDALEIWKSTSGGWDYVQLLKTVSFSSGGTVPPADGDILAQSSVTATIKRVVLTSGSWAAGTAAGQFIIDDLDGGNFSGAVAAAGTATVTLSGTETDISLLPGGKFQIVENNFYGQSVTNRLYGCDGVNPAFEFDGTVLVPIFTGAINDTPTCIATHRGCLWLAIGSSVFKSAPGLPYDWTAINDAAEFATGDTVTCIGMMPGDADSAALVVFNRSNTTIFYQRRLYDGSYSNWSPIPYNTGIGALPFSMQNMAQTFAFDDRGINAIQTALQYGNFTQSALSTLVLPFVNEHINLLTASVLCRRKSQYRLFFSDSFGLFVTVVNNKLLGCMPVAFPNPVTCVYEGKDLTGTDVIFFGSINGMIYQMEKGTSFDGEPISSHIVLNYNNMKSPRTLKRFRKAVPEITAENNSYIQFDFSYILGYDSPIYSQPGDSSFNQYLGNLRWDTFVWDNFFWDSNRFRTPLECPLDGTAENMALMFYGTSASTPTFNINSILIHYTPRRMMR